MLGKLPIPRLENESRRSHARRTGGACQSCQGRKTKCDGGAPACSQCLSLGETDCFYPERKIIRLQKELDSARREIESYREVLDISRDLEGPIADQVAKPLKNSNSVEDQMQRNERFEVPPSSDGLHRVDVVTEDFNRNAKCRATGFMGQNSEVVWMQRLDSEVTRRFYEGNASNTTSHVHLPIDKSVASMNYHLDYSSISKQDVTHTSILPPKYLADQLLQIYMEKVNGSLPFIRQDLFLAQYSCCYSIDGTSPGRKWLAVFNMVLAIACTLGRLSGLNLPREVDENVFSERARSLSLSDNVLYDHGDLQQVQAEALMAFFFLTQSQINRSWKMIGIAALTGIALGLNIKEMISGLDVNSSEARNQLWWSIVRLEGILSVMTGRVSFLGIASCSASPPRLDPVLNHEGPDVAQAINNLQWTIHLREEQMASQRRFLKDSSPTSCLYRFYMIDLSLIAREFANDMCTTSLPLAVGARMERRTELYGKKLDYWASTLHPSFWFQADEAKSLPARMSSVRLSLKLNYLSVQIILCRPCLDSLAFSTGIQAALAVIALLPDEPDLVWCYEVPEWWILLHVLTQAIVVLLLAISIDPAPKRLEETADPFELANKYWPEVEKGMTWLYCLGETSESARRAFQFFNGCILRMDPSKGLGLEGITTTVNSFPTSCDPDFPWFRVLSEEKELSPGQQTQDIDVQKLEN